MPADTDVQDAPEPSDDQLAEVVDKHCTMLMEHFDAVRIFVVKHDPHTDLCSAVSRGRSNYYTQRGAIEDWIISQRAAARRDAAGE